MGAGQEIRHAARAPRAFIPWARVRMCILFSHIRTSHADRCASSHFPRIVAQRNAQNIEHLYAQDALYENPMPRPAPAPLSDPLQDLPAPLNSGFSDAFTPIAFVPLTDVQKGRPKSHIGTALQHATSFPMCNLERPFCTSLSCMPAHLVRKAQRHRGAFAEGPAHPIVLPQTHSRICQPRSRAASASFPSGVTAQGCSAASKSRRSEKWSP